jgi:hypothetical protein
VERTRSALDALEAQAIRHNPYAWVVLLFAWVFALGSVAMGAALLLAPQRMTGVSFTYILDTAPVDAWGVGFLAAGVASAFGQGSGWLWPARLGHTASAGMCAWWACSFVYGATQTPTQPITGVVAYYLLAAAHILIAVVPPPPRKPR